MAVIDIRAYRTPSGKQRQTITNIIQACHGSERVIDRRRHGPDGHFSKLVNGIFDILGGCALVSKMEGVSDFFIQVVINPIGGPDQCNDHATPDKGTWLGHNADDYVLFFGQGKDVFRIYILDVTRFTRTNRMGFSLPSVNPAGFCWFDAGLHRP